MYSALIARTPAARRLAVQSVRCLASKPPPRPTPSLDKPPAPTPPPPTTPTPKMSSNVPSLDFSPSEEDLKQERTGARSSKDSLSSIERKRRNMGRLATIAFLIGAGVQCWYLGREWEEEELKERRMNLANAPSTRWGRTKTRFASIFDLFTEPTWPELLPDPLPPSHQKPYTLLLSVDDLLVTSTWDRQHGWRTAKRPGVDYFLAYLSQFYEVVIFTTQYHYTATPILDNLDRYQFYIAYRLFRDATRSLNGQPVKDLSYLNRDLSKVVLLDTHPEHVTPQPENSIIVPKWTGDPKDRGLVALIPFLESIAIYKPADVRPILTAYHGKDISIEYAKKEAEAKQKYIAEWEQSKKGLASGGFTLSSLFGATQNPPVPLTYLEQKRQEAQLQYREEQAYIATNKEAFEKLIKEDQEAMAREMSGTFWAAMQSFVPGGQPKAGSDGKSPPSAPPTPAGGPAAPAS